MKAEVSRPLTDPHLTTPLNELHRPSFLLSGLLKCGVCGGGFTITAKDRYGCARRRRQGTCTNNRGIRRQELERRVLDGLRYSLFTPDLVAEFITEYQAEWNRLQGERRTLASKRDLQLAGVKRRIAGIIGAIERGIITPSTKQRLEELEAEKAHLQASPAEAPMPALHPNLARLYRDKVARLEEELADREGAAEAKSVLRSLIKTIKVTPGAKRGEVALELHGELAAILLAGQKNKNRSSASRNQISVVAGAGFEPATFRL
jgi:site-specific DNA recombinase